ncbi:MAG: Flagellar hook-associated protein FliD [uncultured Caballeronia sp.]|nr:MAG: Flagellar hook-associated protein FliD [uncultured Caballeronia sp.]
MSTQQTNDNTKLSAIGALQAGVLPLSNSTTLGQFTATADGTGLTATATSGATAGVYSIGVTQIASAQTLSSAAFGATTALGTGTDGAHLVLRSSATGASNTISVEVTGVANDAGLSSLGVTSTPGTNGAASTYTSAVNTSAWTQTASAQDAMFTVDGTAGTSSSNSVTTAVQGLMLNLTAAAIGSPAGKTQTLTVAQNTSSAASAINNFVSLYNALVTTYGQVAGFDSTQAAGSQGGALLGDSTFNTIQNTLAGIVAGGVPNGNSTISLGAIGITLNADGTLTANSTTLTNALTSNPSGVSALFNSTTGRGRAADDQPELVLGHGGLISNSQSAINTDLTSITYTANCLDRLHGARASTRRSSLRSTR